MKRGESRSRLYVIWATMKARCYDETHQAFPRYGARGITVCAEWLDSFDAFKLWALSHGYAKWLTLDRVNGKKGYSPDNCRWATRTQQMHNTRNKSNKRTSRFRGVSRHSKSGRYRAQIRHAKKYYDLGCFATELAAALAYDDAAHRMAGRFARLNFPERILNQKKG